MPVMVALFGTRKERYAMDGADLLLKRGVFLFLSTPLSLFVYLILSNKIDFCIDTVEES